MNIGDLVKVKDIDYSPTVGLFEYNIKAGKYDGWVGMIIEVNELFITAPLYRVLWPDGETVWAHYRHLELANENR